MPKDDNYINFDDKDERDDELDDEIDNELDENNDDDSDFDDEYVDIDEDYIDSSDVEDIEQNDKFDLMYRFNTNKHKQEGKHRLKRDTIFKGKIEKPPDKIDGKEVYDSTNEYSDVVNFFNNQYDSTDDYLDQNNLTKDVYEILKDKTDLDFKQNRRKPNKETFNEYYVLLLKDLGFRYTRSEIFVELSYYFTDNIFNMFKLLDKKAATIIIKELLQKGYLKNLEGINFL